jgi:hypothetical protein
MAIRCLRDLKCLSNVWYNARPKFMRKFIGSTGVKRNLTSARLFSGVAWDGSSVPTRPGKGDFPWYFPLSSKSGTYFVISLLVIHFGYTITLLSPSVPPNTLLPVTAQRPFPLSHFPSLSFMNSSCLSWFPSNHLCIHV